MLKIRKSKKFGYKIIDAKGKCRGTYKTLDAAQFKLEQMESRR